MVAFWDFEPVGLGGNGDITFPIYSLEQIRVATALCDRKGLDNLSEEERRVINELARWSYCWWYLKDEIWLAYDTYKCNRPIKDDYYYLVMRNTATHDPYKSYVREWRPAQQLLDHASQL